jgi:hypothetical protein
MLRTNRLAVLVLCLAAGCVRHTVSPAEAAAYCDLVVLAQLHGNGADEQLRAIEVLKGNLGAGIEYRVGDLITDTGPGSLRRVAAPGDTVLLFYKKRFGAANCQLVVGGSGENAALIEKLRNERKTPR